MNNYSILERLSFHNAWWTTGKVPSSFIPEFRRNIVNVLLSYSTKNRAMLLKGPRRVGKTTALYQVIDTLIKKHVNPKDICYVSLDDPMLKVPLDEIIKIYEQYRGKKLTEGISYFFLDEAQFLKDWELTVKLFLDRKYPIKFFISGSSVSLLTQKVESLAGRTVEEILFPFSFREYLSFFAPQIENHIKKNNILPDVLPDAIIPFISDIKINFSNFLRTGGFPQIYSENEELYPKFIKEDILDKVIFRDLVDLYKIREPAYLEKLFYYLGKNTATIVNFTTLSQSLGISRVVVERYISYLEQALLFFRLPKFSKSLKETLRSNPKGHLIDPALANLFRVEHSQILESAVAVFIFSKFQKNTYFWRDQFHEVDIIIDEEELIPVEVKSSDKKEIPKGLLYIMEKQKLNKGFVVYNGEFSKVRVGKKQIIFCPAWYFLLGEKT